MKPANCRWYASGRAAAEGERYRRETPPTMVLVRLGDARVVLPNLDANEKEMAICQAIDGGPR